MEVNGRLFVAASLLLLAAGSVPALGAGSSPAAEAVVAEMIAAHGGMERWAAAPTVAFTDEFIQPGADAGFPARVVVEQGRRRAYIDYAGTLQLAWDGDKAWSAGSQPPMPPRFLALLNYYFLNLPWLTRDPGVVLGDPGSGKLWDNPTEYTTVRMTFEPGVGDTPDDYYVLYIHPETKRLAATEYIVTYRALLPEGADSTDPHILVYDEWATVDGLVVPTHYTIYELDRSVYITCVARDWSFSEPWDDSWMEMPDGALLDDSEP